MRQPLLANLHSAALRPLPRLRRAELAQLQEEQETRAHLAVETKTSIELDSSIGSLVVSSACPRSPEAAEPAASPPRPTGSPPRLQERPPRQLDMGQWVDKHASAEARRAEHIASRQRKARRAALPSAAGGEALELTEAQQMARRGVHTAARRSPGRQKEQPWRVKRGAPTPSAWAVAPGRGDVRIAAGGAGELRPSVVGQAQEGGRDTAAQRQAWAAQQAPAAARKAQWVAGRAQKAREGRAAASRFRRPRTAPPTTGWSEQPALFRGAGAVGVRDSVAEADVLRERLAQKEAQAVARKNAKVEEKALRARARLETEGRRHHPDSARRGAALASAWRDGRDASTAEALLQSAAAADAALRKLSEAAAAAESRHEAALAARREATAAMRHGHDSGGQEDAEAVGVGERAAAVAAGRGSHRQPRSSRAVPMRPRGRRHKPPKVPEKELQRLREATEQYEAAARAKAGQAAEGGEVVASEASEARMGRAP